MIYIKDKYTVYIHAFISCSLLPDFFFNYSFWAFHTDLSHRGFKDDLFAGQ